MGIGEVLIQAGKITPEQLEQAMAEQSSAGTVSSLDEYLVDAGIISPADRLAALGVQYHLTVMEKIDKRDVDPALLDKVPVEWARKYRLLPIRSNHGVYAVISDPSSLGRIEELSLLLQVEIEAVLAPEPEILQAIDHAYFSREQRDDHSGDRRGKPAKEPDMRTVRTEDLLLSSDAAPVTKLLNQIILDAVRKNASDIHLESFENRLRLRFRIDGILYEQKAPPKEMEQPLISRIKVMSRLDIAEKRLPQDGMAKVRAGEREIDIRVSTVPSASGERVVLRLLDQASTFLAMSELGMSDAILNRFNEVKAQTNGIILVTGPTGSGKTTTLYAALNDLDTVQRNVMTIEDPIEYQMSEVGQIQVKPKIGLTFASGLRHILRQDPDVILVGEIRDRETAEIAVRAALTGHLVFSTLHTNDAVSAVVRLVDMGVPAYLLAESVRAIIAQRLVRRLCSKCRKEVAANEADLDLFSEELRDRIMRSKHYAPVGCDACNDGYRGRVGIYELFAINRNEQQEIRTSMNVDALNRLASDQSSSMIVDAAEKIISGITTIGEVRRVLSAGSRNSRA